MTIVLALKVGDGVVLGADSASTLIGNNGSYHNSYFNAEKLFNLVKGLPIGAVTYGLGGLAGRSVGSLAKDLRARMSDASNGAWYLDPNTYTIAEVADRVRRLFFDELYSKHVPAGSEAPGMGFLIAGYSAGAESAEVWRFNVKDGGCPSRTRSISCIFSSTPPADTCASPPVRRQSPSPSTAPRSYATRAFVGSAASTTFR